MKTKVAIEVKNGEVIAVHSTKPIEYVIIDYDGIDNGNTPVSSVFTPDMVSDNIYEIFTDTSVPVEMEVRDELKRIKF